LGEKYLAAGLLGQMVANATGFSIVMGLGTALDTLCPQAFGAKEYKLVGVYLQRAILILTLSLFPIFFFWCFTEKILITFGNIDQEAAHLSQLWVYCLMVGIWPLSVFDAFRKFLLAQKITIPQTITTVFCALIHIPISYVCIHVIGWGFIGAAIAYNITSWLHLFVLFISYLVYLRYLKSQSSGYCNPNEPQKKIQDDEKKGNLDYLKTWPTPDISNILSLTGLRDYLRLAIPASMALLLEWGTFEVNALIVARSINTTHADFNSTYDGNFTSNTVPISSHAVLANTTTIWWMIVAGLASGLTTSLGNALGEGDVKSAKLFLALSFSMAFIFAVVNAGLAVGYRHLWAALWTNDAAVRETVANCMWILWWFAVWDTLKTVAIGALRGFGRFNATILTNTISCVFVGWPLAWVFAIVLQKSVFGVWAGAGFAWLVAIIIYSGIICRIDWDEEVKVSQERTAEGVKTMDAKADLGLLMEDIEDPESLSDFSD